MRFRSLPLIVPILLVPLLAEGHVSIKNKSFATVTDVVVFGVGHGCEGEDATLDTTSVRVEIPAGVTSVRPEPSGFDSVSLEKDDTGAVIAVTWTKEKSLSEDIAYYELGLRLKTPDAPFTQLTFPAYQTCKSADGETEVVVEWTAAGDHGEGDGPGLAPLLPVLPARLAGWNKYTVDEDIDTLDVFFADAQIVWQGSAAYSVNPATVELIEGTDGASLLSKIKAGKEFWVKY
jgi:periplasmic copper chaperone A